MALNSFMALARKFDCDPDFAAEYRKFMQAYEDLGQMRLIPEDKISTLRAWYLPHHAVMRQSGPVSKLRVFYDASRRTADQQYLNNFLLSGPALQNDLSLILLGCRKHRFVFTADIIKMIRQIEVYPLDQDLQRILWSAEPGQAPRDYCLTTVTYGTSSAPYLTIRTLPQLAEDEEHRFPLGAFYLRHQIYVDDIFSELLLSNSIGVPVVTKSKLIEDDQAVKTLGLLWNPSSDSFGFNICSMFSPTRESTKRNVLSCLARLFDPLADEDLDWDTPLSLDILNRWNNYCNELPKVTDIFVSRWLGLISSAQSELHGFADASMRAYAVAIYLRVTNDEGEFLTSLLIAKSKVVPVKTVTIPNLELYGAVLLTKFLKHVRQMDQYKDLPVVAWSGSRDALVWLRKHPSHWKVFVANRVSFIQTELPTAVWLYIPSRDNPADVATRGLDPVTLKNSKIWWHGPDWLSDPPERWPDQLTTVKPSETVVHAFNAT
ncbi:uncharacterized protein [Prorops nasuta]|uniref:uncharacterized protein n=1 Tax=Prorops nasuta TaxID=863751 RepID=UPI0034CD182D